MAPIVDDEEIVRSSESLKKRGDLEIKRRLWVYRRNLVQTDCVVERFLKERLQLLDFRCTIRVIVFPGYQQDVDGRIPLMPNRKIVR